jgi:hypothetical protein
LPARFRLFTRTTTALLPLALGPLGCASHRATVAVAATPVAPAHAIAPTAPAPAPAVPAIRFVVHDERGRVLPARVLVRGVEGTADPSLGPSHEAAGAGTVVVAVAGRGEIRVPAGRYEITASHGPEWSLARARVEVATAPTPEVVLALRREIPMADWTACDLHVHARPSYDSQVSVADRVASLVAEGIEFATPTEHNLVGDYGPGVGALPPEASLAWAPAVEVTTDHAPTRVGHFNVYPYLPDPRAADGAPPDFRASPGEIFRAARANNPDAIIQVNHPRMAPAIGYFDLMQLDPATNVAGSPQYDPGYDALEVYNGFFLCAPAEVERVLRDWLALLGTGARYVGTASSDSHTIQYEQAGYPRTYVYTPGAGDRAPATPAVLHALRAGRAFGTSGPMLFLSVGERLPGDTVRTSEPAIAVRVRVLAAPWIDVDQVDLYQDGAVVTTLPVPPSSATLRLDQTVTLPLRRPRGFVLATARGDGPLDAVLPMPGARPFAFTNPVWTERVTR